MPTSVAAARARCISVSISPVSAKNDITVWLAGSLPLRTSAFCTPVGNAIPMSLNAVRRGPVEGSEPSHFSTIGTTSVSVNAPTRKNVKSAALSKRSL